MADLTQQWQVRAEFWREMYGRKPAKWRGKSQNDLPADVRTEWVDWVDRNQKAGRISERLAQRVTL